MKRGFTIDIGNKTNQSQAIELFTGKPLPEGVIVSSLRAKFYYQDYFLLDPGNENIHHDYDDLYAIARMTNFNGNTFLIDCSKMVTIEIIKNGINTKSIEFVRNVNVDEITINGSDEYIIFHCPPNSDVIVVFEYM